MFENELAELMFDESHLVRNDYQDQEINDRIGYRVETCDYEVIGFIWQHIPTRHDKWYCEPIGEQARLMEGFASAHKALLFNWLEKRHLEMGTGVNSITPPEFYNGSRVPRAGEPYAAGGVITPPRILVGEGIGGIQNIPCIDNTELGDTMLSGVVITATQKVPHPMHEETITREQLAESNKQINKMASVGIEFKELIATEGVVTPENPVAFWDHASEPSKSVKIPTVDVPLNAKDEQEKYRAAVNEDGFKNWCRKTLGYNEGDFINSQNNNTLEQHKETWNALSAIEKEPYLEE